MIQKIINWTAGGFFRSLGRVLMYIFLGLIATFLLNKSGIKLGQLLGIDYVSAASANYSSTTSQVHAIRPSDGDIMWTTLISPGNTTNVGQYRYIQEFAYRIYGGSNTYTNGNTYTATFTFTIANSGCTSTACFTEFENNIRNNYYVIRVSANTASQHDGNTSADNIASFSYTIAKTPTRGQYRLTVNMVPKVNVKFFIVYFYSKFGEFNDTSGTEQDYVNITSYTYNALSFSYTEGTNAVLTNQTGIIQQQTDIIIQTQNVTNEKLDDINNTLKDDDVDDDSNDMADFLNDFELDSDGAISTLLTLPITFLENVLTTDSSADLCTTYGGQQICLPSGNLIWGRNDITAFKLFFNLIVGGFLSYKMIRSFINTSEKAINPKNNEVEVMKL